MSVERLVERGKMFLYDGKHFQALECFEQAIALRQDDPDLWNFKGVALKSMGRYHEAAECFVKSLRIDPRDKHSS